jgi:hypothetical protein
LLRRLRCDQREIVLGSSRRAQSIGTNPTIPDGLRAPGARLRLVDDLELSNDVGDVVAHPVRAEIVMQCERLDVGAGDAGVRQPLAAALRFQQTAIEYAL